jgi:ATP-dependent Lhr-like helicase
VKLHCRILEKIMELLCSTQEFKYGNETALDLLNELRTPYQTYKVNSNERIIWQTKDEMIFETFTGTKIFRTLVWMLKVSRINVEEYDGLGRLKIVGIYPLEKILEEIKNKEWASDELFKVTKENEWFRSKYLEYIPKELQLDMHASNEIDIDGALKFLKEYKIRIINN